MTVRINNLTAEFSDYLKDESRRIGTAEKIVFPSSVEEIQAAVAEAHKEGWSITMQGGGTGITGGCVPNGGLVMNLSGMTRIQPIAHNRLTVEPGVTLLEVRDFLKKTDFFFPSDLTETAATLGGMVSTNASGARSFFYGSVRKWIDSMDVVLASGELVTLQRGVHKAEGRKFKIGSITGELPDCPSPNVKNAAGYFVKPNMDLIDLFIGAEGTLGVVASMTLILQPKPQQMSGITAFFASEAQAVDCVQLVREHSQPISLEFFDANALNLLRKVKQERACFSDLPELPASFHTAIYMEFEGELPEIVLSQLELAVDAWLLEGDREIARLKFFRHALPEAVNMEIQDRKKDIPDLVKLGTDMSVQDADLANMLNRYHTDLMASGLEYVIFGHIGDNHLHVNIVPRTMEEYAMGREIYLGWAKTVVALGGSVSAEHGVGKIKTDLLHIMWGAEGIEKMKGLKRLFDPAMQLNVGNLF